MSPRWAALALLVAAAIFGAAGVAGAADPTCDTYVDSAEDYIAELACATTGPTSLTLTDDFSVPADVVPLYVSTHALTIDGGGHTVTQSPPLTGPADANSAFLRIETPAGPQQTSVTLNDMTIQGFSATGVYVGSNSSHLIVENSRFVDNGGLTTSPSALAGGIVSMGYLTVTNTDFTNNEGMMGGAIASFPVAGAEANVAVTITGSTFSLNRGSAAGATLIYGAARIHDTVFTGNTSDLGAAALTLATTSAISPPHTLSSVTVRDHHTVSNTVIMLEGGVNISGSLFANNTAATGAVVQISSAEDTGAMVANSTFAGNAAQLGALAVGPQSPLTIVHSTFATNSGDEGAHVTLPPTDTSTVSITGSAFTGAVNGCAIPDNATTIANFDADGTCTNGWTGAGDLGKDLDVQLGMLANNGGPTQTMLPLETSPLVDAVPAGTTSLTTDQRGFPRIADDLADIGAIELAPVTAADDDADVGKTSDGGSANATDIGAIAFEIPTSAGTIYGTASPALAVTDIGWSATHTLVSTPPDTALPFGAATFTVEVPKPGDSVAITLTAPRPFTWIFYVTDGMWPALHGATLSNDGTTVTYTLTDGGPFDQDGEANGVVVAPFALGVHATFTG